MSDMTLLEHRGFHSHYHYSKEDNCLYGKIEDIEDLISYGGNTVAEVAESFRTAIDEYIAFCEKIGKEKQ